VIVTVTDSASPPNQGFANYQILISGGGSAATSSSVRSHAALASSSGVPRYKLIDLGTFGGPASYFSNGYDGILNSNGAVAGWANTSTPDPFCFLDNCFATHAFRVQGSNVIDLGVLDGGTDSQSAWMSANGLIVGFSQNGEFDPLVPGFPEVRAVLWHDGKIIDLGTLAEGGFESLANAVNNRGQAVGFALNTVEDSCSFVGFPTQTRAFLWQNGAIQDLGTLGGPDANAELINDAGQIAGTSYTELINADTGCPSIHPFLWQNGTMFDIGTLGGTWSDVTALNQRGELVGISTLTGDQSFHPFHWSNEGLTDLGTLGGDTGYVNWINDRGEIVGKADLPGPAPQVHDAVLWKKGQKIDLGVLPGDACSNAYFINSQGQIVGTSETLELCTLSEPIGRHAFLREPGGPITDLNTLVPPGSSLDLTFAVAISDRGEIAGFGVPPGCAPQDIDQCGHAYLLIPCGVGEECVNSMLPAGLDLGVSSALNSGITRSLRTPASPLEGLRKQIWKLRPTRQGRLPSD
jgi:probable HAF family extracellular repeat protein